MLRSVPLLALLGYVFANPLPSPAVTPGPTLAIRQDTPSSCIVTTSPAFVRTDTIQAGTTVTVETNTIPEFTYCLCGTGKLSIDTSIDPKGQNVLYCATGGDPTPVSTAFPSGASGDPLNAGWQQVTCDTGVLNDAKANPLDRWNEAGTEAAWEAMENQWWEHGRLEDKVSFSFFVADFFHHSDDPNCETLGDSPCSQPVSCGQFDSVAGEVNSPAGMMIMNSFASLHHVFEITRTAVVEAFPQDLGDIGSLVKNFAAITDEIKEQQALRVRMDIAQGVLTVALAPIFHSMLGRSKWFINNPNVFATIIDSTYGGMGALMAGIKDGMEQLSPLPVQNEYQRIIGDISLSWQKQIEEANRMVFEDPRLTWPLIKAGQYLGDIDYPDPSDAANSLRKAMVATVLPMLWISGVDPAFPFILKSDGMDEAGSCEEYDINSVYEKLEPGTLGTTDDKDYDYHLEDDIETATRVCGSDGKPYWLATAKTEVPSEGEQELWLTTVGVPGNIAALDGKAYGGLTLQEVVMNAVNGYHSAGDNNNEVRPWDVADATNAEGLASGDLSKTGGLVKIPVCSFQEMWTTVNQGKFPERDPNNPNYPCPP